MPQTDDADATAAPGDDAPDATPGSVTDTAALPDGTPEARLRRWRLVLGGGDADGTGLQLGGADLGRDRCLGALYDAERRSGSRQAGLGASSPQLVRWLGDIRGYFPSSVVRVMQQDALDRLGLKSMLLEKEMLEAVEPDVQLVAQLVSLKDAIPAKTRDTAREVIRTVTQQLIRRLQNPMRQAVTGALNRALRARRPRRPSDINWPATIRRNLQHYQPATGSIVPEHLVAHGRRQHSLHDVILCVDQSGSMATSVVYSAIFGAVLSSIPALQTRLLVFDTSVVDLTDQVSDPVDLLFATQLGGGTDIGRAVGHVQALIRRPAQTTVVLISDLYDGGDAAKSAARILHLHASGVRVVVLPALSDEGAPWYNHDYAEALGAAGIPVFACTPDHFPQMMATALNGQSLRAWAALHAVATDTKPDGR